ncbi:putative ATP-dependent RNA helicase DDX10 [Alosa pseudoharengus]|uniref:putative ATP-dependent RNA helicase DDX10 n=1 Tax=Alosa pseudoharengus TaxID=34774 RepID=UPI003F8BF766
MSTKPQRKVKHVSNDPVGNFEKWKKKYNRTKKRVKQVRQPTKKKRVWETEQDGIKKLVAKYAQINPKDAVNFSDFPLSKKTLKALVEAQYRQPTEIQRQTIGFALQGKDVLGAAKTGSGKTLAFLIPVLECLYRNQWTALDGLGALIISPTRELAYQTFQVLRKVGKNHEFSAGLIIGGKDLKDEAEKIHRTNIIICTPGRLLQHMDQTSAFHVSDLLMLVLDEADRILDLGFSETLNAIVEHLPTQRQTLLFSATQTKSVKDLARLSLNEPEYVWVHEQAKFSTPATLEQSYVVCELHQKVDMLFSFLRSHIHKKIIVFFACCKEVQYLFRVFCRLRPGISVLALHGKQQQMKRVEAYNDFVGKKSAVLFATDIAARGLDFPAVNWVLQFDCPEDANTYIHRVGRTARYQQGGEALLVLLPSEENAMVAALQERRVPINKIQINPEKLVSVQQKLEAFLAQEKEQKERAQRCFISYLRSIFLMKNKQVFDVTQIKLSEYAASLGLAVAPRVRFLSKAQKPGHKEQEDEDLGKRGEEDEEEEDDEDEGESDKKAERSSEEEEDSETEDPAAKLKGLLCNSDDDDNDEDDLKDLDLLTVKRKDVFNVNMSQDEEDDDSESEKPKGRQVRASKVKEAKRVRKKNFKVNTKIVFTDGGEVVQQWPVIQRPVVSDNQEEQEEESGINFEKAKERLRLEDQEYDKNEYRRRVHEKHREKRLKDKAARREAYKQQKEEKEKRKKQEAEGNEEDDDESDGDEPVAYLAGADDFDISALPDPDKYRDSDSEGSDHERGSRKRRASDSEDEEPVMKNKGKKRSKPEVEPDIESNPLDTGLSLGEDEELVLHLLGQRS